MKKSKYYTKILSFFKNKKNYISIFLLTFLLQVGLYILLNLIHGSQIFLISDLKEQYLGLFNYYKGVFNGSNSIFYSFQKGIGGPMYGIFCYYLMSPFNLILLLFNKLTLYNGILLVLMMKVSMCALTMYIFLKNQFSKKDTLFLFMFSLCYAFMAYNVCYSYNILWLDVVYMAPLVLLGIDKILEDKKPIMYIISLFLALLFNYYIAYMLGIFSIIYFIYKLLLKYKIKKDIKIISSYFFRFLISSLLAVLLASCILLPVFLDLQSSTKSASNIMSSGLVLNFNWLKIFTMQLVGQNNVGNVLNREHFLLYCGIIILPLILFYFINKKISKREKFLTFIVFSIFLLSFSINILDNIWHGMNIAICYEGRYTYLTTLFILYISAISLFKIKDISKKQYLIVLPIIPILILLVFMFKVNIGYSYLLLISAGLFIMYVLLLSQLKENFKLVKFLIFGLVLAELMFNFYISLYKYNYEWKNNYVYNIKTYQKELTKTKDKSYNRVSSDALYTDLDSMLFIYNDTNLFLSIINKNISKFYVHMGYTGLSNVYYSNFSSPIFDSIMNISYKITPYNSFYQLIGSVSQIYMNDKNKKEYIVSNLYNNTNNLGLGFLTTNNINKNIKYQYPIQYQNDVFQKITDSNQSILKYQPLTKLKKGEYQLKLKTDDLYFLQILNFKYPSNGLDSDIKIYVNGTLFYNYTIYNKTIIPLSDMTGRFAKGKTIKITVKTHNCTESPLITTYSFNKKLYQNKMQQTKIRQMNIIKFNNNYIKARVNVKDKYKTLFTSIPVDEGWTIYVDGKEKEKQTLLNCFLGITLNRGQHIIEFKYKTPGFIQGIALSFIGLILTIIYIKKYNKKDGMIK